MTGQFGNSLQGSVVFFLLLTDMDKTTHPTGQKVAAVDEEVSFGQPHVAVAGLAVGVKFCRCARLVVVWMSHLK